MIYSTSLKQNTRQNCCRSNWKHLMFVCRWDRPIILFKLLTAKWLQNWIMMISCRESRVLLGELSLSRLLSKAIRKQRSWLPKSSRKTGHQGSNFRIAVEHPEILVLVKITRSVQILRKEVVLCKILVQTVRKLKKVQESRLIILLKLSSKVKTRVDRQSITTCKLTRWVSKPSRRWNPKRN